MYRDFYCPRHKGCLNRKNAILCLQLGICVFSFSEKRSKCATLSFEDCLIFYKPSQKQICS